MLQKNYEICGREIALKNSAFLPKLYRAMFNRDLIVDISTVLNSKERTAEYTEIIEDIVYAMAAHADEEIGTQQEFLESFDSGLFTAYAVNSIMDIWVEGSHMTTENGKKKGRARAHTTAVSSSSDAQN